VSEVREISTRETRGSEVLIHMAKLVWRLVEPPVCRILVGIRRRKSKTHFTTYHFPSAEGLAILVSSESWWWDVFRYAVAKYLGNIILKNIPTIEVSSLLETVQLSRLST
jgi:hypothetical protein